MTPRLLWSTSLLTFCFAAAVFGSTNSAPAIRFAETEFNFGRVQAGELVKHNFVFTNTGTATLEITAVQPGCGCTTAGTWDKRVEPGKTGLVPLQFNSANFGGDISKQATVICNDPAQGRVVLFLKGKVWKTIDIEPPMVVFNLTEETTAKEMKTVRIANNLTNAVSVWDVHCDHPNFQAVLKTNTPGKEYQLEITAIPPFRSGTIVGPITLRTSASNMPSVNVAAYTVVHAQVQLNPTQINLPAGPLGSRMSPGVYISSSWTNALKLSDAKANIDGVAVQITEVTAGKMFNVSASFPEGFENPAGKQLELEVKSNHPKFAVIKIPVLQPEPEPKTATPAEQSAAAKPAGSAQ
jgi:hypothetical protein